MRLLMRMAWVHLKLAQGFPLVFIAGKSAILALRDCRLSVFFSTDNRCPQEAHRGCRERIWVSHPRDSGVRKRVRCCCTASRTTER